MRAGFSEKTPKRPRRPAPALVRERREVSKRREHLRTQNALPQSEARLRSLIEHAVFGIYQATLDGVFLSVNPALVTMLGYDSAEELLSIGVPPVCLDAKTRSDLLSRVHALASFTGEEMAWRRKNGEPIRVRLSGRLVKAADELSILEIMVEDVTEQRHLEEQLRQAQKMEAIGQLAGGIAHDFNNMLTPIVGYCEMVLEQIGPDKPISADLIEIRKAAVRAAGLTRQLLAFSRQQQLRIGILDLNEIARGIQPMLQRLIGEHITVLLELDSEPRRILADPVQLEQVLLNLATNARDAMPGGGQLTIATSVSRAPTPGSTPARAPIPGGPPGGRTTVLRMTDTGTGMDARTLENVFEPFFTTKALGKGTGLGLATVHGIVRQLEGTVDVASAVGQGTTFTLSFPEPAGDTSHAVPAAIDLTAARLARGREHVLVVEDEPGVRTLVVRTLMRHGYEVVEADSGEQALSLATRDGRIDVVVSDVVMPGMSGPEMVTQLRQAQPHIKVLYMSGYAADSLPRLGLLEQSDPLLEKPFTAHALLRAVRNLSD